MKLTCYTLGAPGWELAPGRPDRAWMDEFEQRHPYRCLPLVIANTTGWEILSPCDFTATWNGGPRAEDIRVDADDGFTELARLATSHFTRGVVTFHTGYLFRTEPGWDLWVGGPPNLVKDGIQPLSGIVETDWLPFPFTMNWHFTRPGMVTFTKGEPFCFVMPVPHAAVEAFEPVMKKLADEPELAAEYEAWRGSREGFLKGLAENDAETIRQKWQRHYYKGQSPAGGTAAAEDHVHRRRLKPPRPAKPGE
ncbi:MAG: DUF6065 family protein [Hyphomonadaceae bacterium]